MKLVNRAHLNDEIEILASVDRLKPQLIRLTQQLVRIQSVSGNERDAQEFVQSQLEQIGFDVKKRARVRSRPNLLCNLDIGSKTGKNILFIAHIDNIPAGDQELWKFDPYSGKIVNGRIFGRGVADMKAGLAAMIIASRAIQESRIDYRGRISIASVVDEEVESKYGMRYLVEQNLLRADSCLFGEPSFPYVVTALKGGVWLKLVTHGKKVGSGWPEQGVNAVTKMGRILTQLESLNLSTGVEKHPLLGKPTIAPGTTIRGGDSLHSVPDRCEATIEIYTVPGQSSNSVFKKIESFLNIMKTSDRELSFTLEKLFEVSPTITDANEKIFVDLQSSIRSIFGKKATPVGIPSLGDARFTKGLGIPTIIAYGPGERGRGHVANESVKIENLVAVAKVYALTAFRFCNFPS